MMKSLLTIAALFCATASMVFAEDAASKERLEQLFKNFDTNKDGSISLDEYKAGMVGNMAPERVASVFKEKDHNSDGKLSMEELLYAPKDPATTEKKDDKKPVKKDEGKKTK